jgi:hypothetical protein
MQKRRRPYTGIMGKKGNIEEVEHREKGRRAGRELKRVEEKRFGGRKQ